MKKSRIFNKQCITHQVFRWADRQRKQEDGARFMPPDLSVDYRDGKIIQSDPGAPQPRRSKKLMNAGETPYSEILVAMRPRNSVLYLLRSTTAVSGVKHRQEK